MFCPSLISTYAHFPAIITNAARVLCSETLRLLRLGGDGGSPAQVTPIGQVEDAGSSRGDPGKFDGPN